MEKDNLLFNISIGLVLGDASINKYSKGVQLTFSQSDKNLDYFNQVYALLSVISTCKRHFTIVLYRSMKKSAQCCTEVKKAKGTLRVTEKRIE